MIQRVQRLAHTRDIRELYRRGRRIETRLFRLFFSKNRHERFRIVLIAPRLVAKQATVRNRIRRRAREWVRRRPEIVAQPLDAALYFKKGSVEVSRSVFYQELEELFKKMLQTRQL